MSNQYLVKVAEQLKQAGLFGMIGKTFGSSTGRTINAVKNSAGVHAAKTPVRDAVTFMKANKKPLAIGAGIVGAAGALYHKLKRDGHEKSAMSTGHKYLRSYGNAIEDKDNRGIVDATKVGLGTAYGGASGFFANEYLHNRRINKFMGTITPANLSKATTAQLLDAAEGLSRISSGKVPKPKLGRVGAAIGGGLMLGKVVHDRLTKKANYKENEMTNKYLEKQASEMTNKYLEKVAADHTLKGLVSPAWQEHAIAKEHGKKGPGVAESIAGDIAGRVRQSLDSGAGAIKGAVKGLGTGALLGGLGGALMMRAGHKISLGKAISSPTAAGLAGMMGATGAVIGGAKGGYNGLMDTVKQHAKEVHREYSTGAIDKHRKDVNNMAKEQYHKHMVEGYPTKSEINNMAKEQYHKHMVEGYPTKSEINNMALKQYALHNKQASEKWIQGAIKHPGALHKALGIPADQKIPEAKLHAAAKKGGKIGHEARLAETLKKMHHGK